MLDRTCSTLQPIARPVAQERARPVVAMGRLSRRQQERITRAASAACLEVEFLDGDSPATPWFDSHDALAVLVALGQPGTEATCISIRSNPALSPVPILGLAQEVQELSFADIYGVGGDDVVNLTNPVALERRFHTLPRNLAHQAPTPRGKVLLVDADDRRRLLMARLLRNAGYDIHFSLDVRELGEMALSADIVLVAVDVELDPAGVVGALAATRSAGITSPWVLSVPPKRMGRMMELTRGVSGVTLSDAFAPLENILFTANEALRGSMAERRSSPRLLYGATVGFRTAGREADDHGFVYNISAGGLYVRTLAPLMSGDEAWIELRPPRTDRYVRLEAKVVWQRLFGPVGGATVPPGFGLCITGGSAGDLKRFQDGYGSFARDLASVAMSMAPRQGVSQ
ncbi:MAG: PilZ domain-containing protein [Deltaproteobacteria bacterium]|nr:PilZ domain-containing protein [Deltaproteobacteria bacterium]